MSVESKTLTVPNPDPVTFDRPPVVESILGVQFDPIPKFKNAHLGAYWKTLGKDWPQVFDEVPLEPQFERFDLHEGWGRLGFQIKLTRDPSTRLMIRHENNERMIQVQNGRFHYNWLGQPGQSYPRYRTVKIEFDKLFVQFCEFLENESLTPLRPNQWEVTYVNQIAKGELWNSPSDWPTVIKSLAVPSDVPNIARLESLGAEWHFEIPPSRGRLHIHLQHGTKKGKTPNPQEHLVLTLTARGPIQEDIDLSTGLTLGRDTIVNTFKSVTTDRAHKFWGLHS